jgi:DNA replication protein DnaC
MDKDQLQAYQLALSGHNLLILGQAGTVKTFLTTKIVNSLRHRGKQHRRDFYYFPWVVHLLISRRNQILLKE